MMKLLRFKTLVSLSAALCVFATSVSAAVIDSAVYNTKTNTVTVRGNMQEVPEIKSSGNLLIDSSCDGTDGVWVKRIDGTVASLPEYDGSSNNVVKVTDRQKLYHGIRQNIYTQLTAHGKGYWRISGKIKADPKAYTVTNASSETVTATLTNSNMYANIQLNGGLVYSLTIKNVGSEWVEFSGILNVEQFGYVSKDDKTELTAFDSANTCLDFIGSSSAKAMDSDGNEYTVEESRDFYIDNVTLEKIEYTDIYRGVETARIAVTDAEGNIVYINETNTNADGNYAISFQLPDGIGTSGLTAKVNGKNTDPVEEALITSAAVNANIKSVYTGGKLNVSFDIFDFFDSENYSEVTAVVASYMVNGNICDVKAVPVTIDLATSPTQSVEVSLASDDAAYVRLFLINDLRQIVPLCAAPLSNIIATEATGGSATAVDGTN